MRVKLHNDGYNEIVFKPTTKKVVIGINTGSFYGCKYKSFKADTKEKALEIGVDYINKKSKVKINNF